MWMPPQKSQNCIIKSNNQSGKQINEIIPPDDDTERKVMAEGRKRQYQITLAPTTFSPSLSFALCGQKWRDRVTYYVSTKGEP
jgi:hypothetical protein